MQAIVVRQPGGVEALDWTEIPDPTPAPGELLIKVAVAGVNYIDTYHRSGLYPIDLPFIPGREGAGQVVKVGEGIADWGTEDRVAWCDVSGSYAPLVSVPAGRAVRIPDEITDEQAAGLMLQGLTAHYLVHDTFPLQAGQRCLVHAGAGGVGRLLIQMARSIGAEVFATAGGREKCEIARSAGAHHVIDYTTTDFGDAAKKMAGGKALDVVYDGVGKATFDRGLGLLRPRGMMVTFGNASGRPDPVPPLRLMEEGSLFLTRPSLTDYISTTTQLRDRAEALFGLVRSGVIDLLVGARLPLAEAAEAHQRLEGRATVGKVLLFP